MEHNKMGQLLYWIGLRDKGKALAVMDEVGKDAVRNAKKQKAVCSPKG
jgi:hypothetical protein